MKLEVLFAPAEFATLNQRDLRDTVCVVFDVLRATSSMIAALGNGASGIWPVADIAEALTLRLNHSPLLLAGEREGLRIRAHLTGGVDFDLGNSPREFTAVQVQGKTIAMTTTNGTRALRACLGAKSVFIGTFLNLRVMADRIHRDKPTDLLVVCSGTFDQAAYEDVLGAGALCQRIWSDYAQGSVADSARIARNLFRLAQTDLLKAVACSRNGARLLSQPELADDVEFCLRRDVFDFLAEQDRNGFVRRCV